MDQWSGMSPYLDEMDKQKEEEKKQPLFTINNPNNEDDMALRKVKSEHYRKAAEYAYMAGKAELGNSVMKLANSIYQDPTMQQDQDYKYTMASVMRGTDGNWWMVNPKTGNFEYNKNGKWTYDPNVPVPDAVSKEQKNVSSETEGMLSQAQALKFQIGRIGDQMKSVYDKFGPVQGRVEVAKLNFFNDAFIANLNARMNTLFFFVYQMSGKQVADKEIERYEGILASLKDPNMNATEKLRVLDQYLTNLYNTRLGNLSALRYNVGNMEPLKYTDFGVEEPSPPSKPLQTPKNDTLERLQKRFPGLNLGR